VGSRGLEQVAKKRIKGKTRHIKGVAWFFIKPPFVNLVSN
jgi:hypothetical protein